MFAFHKGIGRLDSHRRHMCKRFFRSNRPGYPHLMCSELENSGIRVEVSDCTVTERRGDVPLIKLAKLYLCTQTQVKHEEAERTAPGVCGHGSVPLSHLGNVGSRNGLHTHFWPAVKCDVSETDLIQSIECWQQSAV